MNQGGDGGGVGRFTKTAVLGGVAGGVLSVIPLVSALNCCFFLLVMGGAAVGLSMYLREHPGEKLSSGDAAVSGAISGVVAGVIVSVVGSAIGAVMAVAMPGSLHQLPSTIRPLVDAMHAGGGTVRLAVGPFLYGVFGALGGYLSMHILFRDRLLEES
jgi:hypothetical protein